MPQLNAVKDLKTLALECVSKYVLDVSFKMKNDLIGSHKYFTDKVPASIRTDILACTSKVLKGGTIGRPILLNDDYLAISSLIPQTKFERKINFSQWNGVINAMLDKSVYWLPCLYFYKNMKEELVEFVSILNRYNTNIQNLSVDFVDFAVGIPPVNIIDDTIMYLLKNNLASKLSCLVLRRVCNIAMLKVIGMKSLCLKYLDLINSPCVEEMGIGYLLFKNYRFMETADMTDTELCQMLNKFNNNEEMLNPCCWTLEELIVEKSSRCYASLLMILSCVKTLKTVGSNMEYGWPDKSVGDAIVTVWENCPKPRIFKLTVLCDINLTIDKLVVFGECLPYVENVTTDISSLVVSEQTSLFWGRVKTLEIKPRSRSSLNNFHFHEFMSLYGHNLVLLAFDINDTYDIDVAKLLKSCPNLETVQGKLQIFKPPVGQFSKLQKMFLINPDVETSNWFFGNCPYLEEAKINVIGDDLSLIHHIIKDPPLFVCNSLKRLLITVYSYRLVNLNLLTPETIIQFIIKCSNLKELGVLSSWRVGFDSTQQIRRFVRQKNYDLYIY